MIFTPTETACIALIAAMAGACLGAIAMALVTTGKWNGEPDE